MPFFNSHTLVFKRYSSGYYQGGDWVSSPVAQVTTKGSLQPFRTGNSLTRMGIKTEIEERGYSSTDAKLYYTETRLQTFEQYSKISADETTLDGKEYFVFAVKPFDGYGTSLDHYEVILVKKDKAG